MALVGAEAGTCPGRAEMLVTQTLESGPTQGHPRPYSLVTGPCSGFGTFLLCQSQFKSIFHHLPPKGTYRFVPQAVAFPSLL